MAAAVEPPGPPPITSTSTVCSIPSPPLFSSYKFDHQVAIASRLLPIKLRCVCSHSLSRLFQIERPGGKEKCILHATAKQLNRRELFAPSMPNPQQFSLIFSKGWQLDARRMSGCNGDITSGVAGSEAGSLNTQGPDL